MERQATRLVVGVGNVLKRDDGFGVRAADVLARLPLPEDVEVHDAGTAGPELAALLGGRRLVVVIDALDAGGEPGALYRLSPDDLEPGARSGLSLHDVHVLDALVETRVLGDAPDRVVILAVQVGDVSTGIGLTPRVKAALEEAIHLAAAELGIRGGLDAEGLGAAVRAAAGTSFWNERSA